MATANLGKCAAVMTDDGGPPIWLEFQEGASVTAVAGEIATLSGGRAVEGTDNETKILGVFAEDGHNGTAGANKIRVWLADPRNIFSANLCSAAGTGAATAITDVGSVAVLLRDTTNSYLQVGNTFWTANSRVVIVGHDGRDALGDTGGRVLFRFLGRFNMLGVTS